MSLLVRYVTHHRANLHSRSAQCLAYFPEKNTKEEEEEEEEEKEQNEMIENGERGRASEREKERENIMYRYTEGERGR